MAIEILNLEDDISLASAPGYRLVPGDMLGKLLDIYMHTMRGASIPMAKIKAEQCEGLAGITMEAIR